MMKKALYTAVILSCVFISLSSWGQSVPQLINYQGKLVDGTGTPLTTGEYNLSFSIYKDPEGGDPLWGPEVHAQVPVVRGYFNVMLGSKTPNIINGFWGDAAFLEITVGESDSPLLPRQQILSSPYALKAEYATHGVPPGTILPYGGEVTGTPPPGYLFCDGSDVSSTEYPALYAAIGTSWGKTVPGDGKFRLPDLRGLFLRGVDRENNPRDPDSSERTVINEGGNTGRMVGSYQGDVIKTHNHPMDVRIALMKGGNKAPCFDQADPGGAHMSPAGTGLHTEGDYWWPDCGQDCDGTNYRTLDDIDNPTAKETRPKNAYVNYIIKY